MASQTVKRALRRVSPFAVLAALLVVSLAMMTAATQNSALLGHLYSLLLVVNVIGVALLSVLIFISVRRLVRQVRAGVMGSRLTLRLFMLFVLLSVIPVLIVYAFSVQAFNRGIDNWFDVRVEQALDSALALGRTALDTTKEDLTRKAHDIAAELDGTGRRGAPMALNTVRDQYGLFELTLFAPDGKVLTSSSQSTVRGKALTPDRPSDNILAQVRDGQAYAGIEPLGESGLQLRVVVPLVSRTVGAPLRVLQIIEPLPDRYARLGRDVQAAFAEYQKLYYLRGPLKFGFLLTLSLVALSTLLFAVWASIFAARRLVNPIRDLAEGTRAVAQGDYSKQLPVTAADELGILVQSFNDMTNRIRRAQGEIQRGRREAEVSRTYLETVLTHLSSGVLSFDARGRLRTHNTAANQILGLDLASGSDRPLDWLDETRPALAPFTDALRDFLANSKTEWQAEITLAGDGARRVLILRGTRLPGLHDRHSGHVVVFDDITALIQAQRDAAWGEVARRLAHEIKNPLTPIQLSAERIRRKCMDNLPDDARATLDRATHTIVQQVEAMKTMVNAFSEYARPAPLHLQAINLNQLIQDVVELYKNRANPVRYELQLDPALPPLAADAGRLRQVLHNLLLNATDALAGTDRPTLTINTRRLDETAGTVAELVVRDNGPGFAPGVIDRLFEPYVTTKERGTGLGLAIVKKIVEEHNGTLWAGNLKDGGATLTVRLPVTEPAAAAKPAAREQSA
jgi:nitrogen fixation/metabolism regulation signal transduction histidine kinase